MIKLTKRRVIISLSSLIVISAGVYGALNIVPKHDEAGKVASIQSAPSVSTPATSNTATDTPVSETPTTTTASNDATSTQQTDTNPTLADTTPTPEENRDKILGKIKDYAVSKGMSDDDVNTQVMCFDSALKKIGYDDYDNLFNLQALNQYFNGQFEFYGICRAEHLQTTPAQ